MFFVIHLWGKPDIVLLDWRSKWFHYYFILPLCLQRQQSSMKPGYLPFSLSLWSGGEPVDRMWSVFNKWHFFPLMFSKCSGLDPSISFLPPVRSVEGKAGRMQKSTVMNPHHRQRSRRRRTGGITNQLSWRRWRREKGRRLQRKRIFHCGTATRPRCPPSL